MAWLVSLCFFWGVVILGLAVVQCPRLFFEKHFINLNYHTMKKHYLKCSKSACLILTTLLSLISSNVIAQVQLQITPELSKSIIDKFNIQDFNIYRVMTKEIEYYPYVDGQVNTKGYDMLLEELAKYKPEYDRYKEEVYNDSIKRSEIRSVLNSIDTYLASKDKSDIKDEILIKAQAIADKYHIEIKGENTSFLAKQANDHGLISGEIKTFKLHNGKKSSSKKDIEFYKSELLKMKFDNLELTSGAYRYTLLLEEEKTKQKTELGKVISDKPSKKLVNVIIESPVDVSTISGEFTLLPDEYSLILENVEHMYVKNELTNEHNEYNEKVKTERYYIIKKTNSDERYYIMSNTFLTQIKNEIDRKRYINMSNDSEYKTWKAKYLSLIQSAQTNVNVCKAIIAKHTYVNRRGEKMYDSNTFTSQEKITFNKNLDTLELKNKQIRELEADKVFYNYYNDKATMEESARSYHLTDFFNTTSYSN